ncbi:terminase small subunit [Pseudoxanthomonas wuyuanensis]|uniref:Uncharacterized protein n=1 Tax=Pseudoxanthomonas wuyuanensis TaxID=1073196 RepID=A0A286D9J2_9GAMM|nr:terminase small subunit [Pseudoxanthomonas wuyuanensis]KAF1721963.1 hypothetical protein CSC75_04380 [Pseudoxanthomonas wuyuanensis]SOD55310.1 hypothetical protein SAMN06296416_106280 [Pseudoxanthomonas wuyuanensis]
MHEGLPIGTAAQQLGIAPGTLRRWVREGCPVAARGRRGRGHAVLIDPDAVLQWRGAGERERLLLELAGAIPGLLAEAAVESLRQAEGLDKRRLAGTLAATWYLSTTTLLDHLRMTCPAVPDLAEVPEQIERLKKIAR